MSELDCDHAQDHVAELALGALCGRARADTLDHLQSCDRCQDDVTALTTTATRLLELIPESQPSAGFEYRVLAAITAPAPAATRTPAGAGRAAALVAAAVLLAGSGWLAGLGHQQPPATDEPVITQPVRDTANVISAPLISADHEIGTAYLHPNGRSWIFLSITGTPSAQSPLGAAATTVNCALVRDDGTTVPLGRFDLHDGGTAWGVHTTVDARSMAGAQITAGDGKVLASARFPSTPPAHGYRRKRDQGKSDR
jgi:hypothetical protein